MARDRDPFLSQPGVPVVNLTGEDVPAWAVVKITGSDADGFGLLAKPAADSDPHVYLNGPQPIPAAPDDGPPYRGVVSFEPLHRAAIDAAGDFDDDYGSAANSWALAKGNTGFRYVGEPSADGTNARVARVGCDCRVEIAGPDNTTGVEDDAHDLDGLAWSVDAQMDATTPTPLVYPFPEFSTFVELACVAAPKPGVYDLDVRVNLQSGVLDAGGNAPTQPYIAGIYPALYRVQADGTIGRVYAPFGGGFGPIVQHLHPVEFTTGDENLDRLPAFQLGSWSLRIPVRLTAEEQAVRLGLYMSSNEVPFFTGGAGEPASIGLLANGSLQLREMCKSVLVTNPPPAPLAPPPPPPPPPPSPPPPPLTGNWYCVVITAATPFGTGVGCVDVGSVMALQIPGTPTSPFSFSATGGTGGCNYTSNIVAGPCATEEECGC